MDGQVTAIELQGIVRNRTKIGVEDGQAEDLLNLRFVDGAWRTSGNGRRIEWTMGDVQYEQLYIHTNVYRHLLGVNPKNKKLYWFANIDKDNVTFTPLDEPIALTEVEGDIWITQTGHLLTVIDEADNFEYFVFHTSEDDYVKVQVDENEKQTDRGIYPFGQVRFNVHKDDDATVTNLDDLEENEYPHIKASNSGWWKNNAGYSIDKDKIKAFDNDFYNNLRKTLYGKQKENNKFTSPFFAIVALKLYDGTFAYCSNPILIYPNERADTLTNMYGYKKIMSQYDNTNSEVFEQTLVPITQNETNPYHATRLLAAAPVLGGNEYEEATMFVTAQRDASVYKAFNPPVFVAGCAYTSSIIKAVPRAAVLGYDLCLSFGNNADFLTKYSDLIKSIAIFVTNEVSVYNEKEDGEVVNDIPYAFTCYQSYQHPVASKEKIIYDLLHSPFYLLREYNKNNINELLANPIVDLSAPEYDGRLTNLTQQDTLKIEASGRLTYLPKYSYNYNGRLHIANYKTRQFHGYPIDLFQLHNHSVQVAEGEWLQGVLPNLKDNNDKYLQYEKKSVSFDGTTLQHQMPDLQSMAQAGLPLAYVSVEIETDNGIQRVVRYIDNYDFTTKENGRADFVEALNPLLTFPDYRAKSMTVYVAQVGTDCRDGVVDGENNYTGEWYKATFPLKPHPLYNFAYYIDPELKPITIGQQSGEVQWTIASMEKGYGSTLEYESLPKEQNTEEYFPNGLKVTMTDNPMVFPAENAYQIGSGEILAMCSNTVAVGTGQTGAAPLYVFCSDGLYALFVDASGEMTYTNARAIARDVLNNPRSVTPIDEGVVFTTDRGLMMIAGEQVQEIGQPAEGDVLQYFNTDSVDSIKIADGALKKVGGFIDEALCDKTDFLTYLKGAIINYNHNERELMVSNPDKSYSYIMDRNGNWLRRDYTSQEYVNNYPTSYRLQDGVFYKVDEEGDNDTPLEEKKEADNKFFYLSNIIKLGSIGFKQGARFVVRGFFNAMSGKHIGCYIFGSYDGRKWAMLGGNEKTGTFTDIGCKIERTDVKFLRVCLAGQMQGDSRIDYMEISSAPSVLNTKIR